MSAMTTLTRIRCNCSLGNLWTTINSLELTKSLLGEKIVTPNTIRMVVWMVVVASGTNIPEPSRSDSIGIAVRKVNCLQKSSSGLVDPLLPKRDHSIIRHIEFARNGILNPVVCSRSVGVRKRGDVVKLMGGVSRVEVQQGHATAHPQVRSVNRQQKAKQSTHRWEPKQLVVALMILWKPFEQTIKRLVLVT